MNNKQESEMTFVEKLQNAPNRIKSNRLSVLVNFGWN